jgi:hypothetical protein
MIGRLFACLLSLTAVLALGCSQPARLADSQVVCAGCPADYLASARPEVKRGIDRLVDFTGSDLLAMKTPVTVHLSADVICPEREVIYGDGQACLGSYDRRNETADSNVNVPYFAAMMGFVAWTEGRIADGNDRDKGAVSELMRYVAMAATDFCATDDRTSCDPCRLLSPAAAMPLLRGLCQEGLQPSQMKSALRALDREAREKGAPVSDAELHCILRKAAGLPD